MSIKVMLTLKDMLLCIASTTNDLLELCRLQVMVRAGVKRLSSWPPEGVQPVGMEQASIDQSLHGITTDHSAARSCTVS